ncbi:hypothetical protein B0H14DRAFT_320444 [Mycena olivaceomarginata]|nr:hypothetical protein B0H14DRAFT_320444 [Mycena olivaceomarginata]
MGEQRMREVVDYVLVPQLSYNIASMVPKSGLDGEYADHRERTNNMQRSAPRPRATKSSHPHPEAAVYTSLEDALNEACSRNERAGTIPMGGRKVTGAPRERRKRELMQKKPERELAPPPTVSTSSGHPPKAVSPSAPPTSHLQSQTDIHFSALSTDKFFRYSGPPWPMGAGPALNCHQCRGRSGGICMTFTGCNHAYCVRCIMKRYEPGTVPFVLQASATECLKCQNRCTCDNCTKIRGGTYRPPERRDRSSGKPHYPAYSDLEKVVIKEPMVYYAMMYDCRTSAPIAETFVGADGGVVVQARPLQKRQRVSVGEEGPRPTVSTSSMPAGAAWVPGLGVDKDNTAPILDLADGIPTHVAMPQTQPSFALSASSSVVRVGRALPRHASAPSNYQNFPPSTPSLSLYHNSSSLPPKPQTYDDFFALLFNHGTPGASS